ncbi:MAG: hypothetical protein E4G98_06380 [Promethearchaeota archaeon]|nr:MAG: hypothetical protein E4G98_06380 [Candidatus Lokiarchaeota archaeon]
MSEKAHNTIIGCLKCQLSCPANTGIGKLQNQLPSLNEEEVQAILRGISNEVTKRALCEKLQVAWVENFENVIVRMQRNMDLLLQS